ncbi:pilus assembly protein CpaF [Paraburkholderia bannensis]|uniref:Pilus assembly protein CpaF n=1 Tax=Paraburkholderia bannensis TaxID=765414 RepID=A0A7W9TZC3_9BURK|nr:MULTISPECIES: CpaF family protein [Paraburkholderia]MBB3259137.1 pilus assembly protein CpaF [Paraburkholderia sp. WP4_3_2]MBB6104152.1 pilus assembly protein CpaF [Paraburkholderia bannensis]
MSLRDHISAQRAPHIERSESHNGSAGLLRAAYQKLKRDIHQAVLERVELERLARLPSDQVRQEIATLIARILEDQKAPANDLERRQLVTDVYDEMFGFGPLEVLLRDPTISDILVNTGSQIYIERKGRLELSDVTFYDDAHLMKVIEKIVSRVGRRIDESSPMVDARLPDGSRLNAIIPPAAVDGPLISIRRFSATPLQVCDLIALQTLTPPMAEVLDGLARAKINILVSGGTGSGKTTLLNLLSGFIPADERIVTIEDAAELQLRQPHVLRLETRPENIEGRGEITQRTLVKNALRMRPDRIILGEVRGAEALDMLNAMNTGHEGSLATIHANTPRDALTRLENMIGMGGLALPPRTMRQQIASAITVVVQVARLTDGRRKIISLSELTGMEGDMINMQEIFTFRRSGVDTNGNVRGAFQATGVRPKFSERLEAFGVRLADATYDPTRRFEAS